MRTEKTQGELGDGCIIYRLKTRRHKESLVSWVILGRGFLEMKFETTLNVPVLNQNSVSFLTPDVSEDKFNRTRKRDHN